MKYDDLQITRIRRHNINTSILLIACYTFRVEWLLWSTSQILCHTMLKQTKKNELCLGLHHTKPVRWREPSPSDGSKMKSFENTSVCQTKLLSDV